MIPLNLTSRQQSCLAELCSILRGELYTLLTRCEDGLTDDESAEQLGHMVFEWIDKYDLKPTDLDVLYDHLHRSGANS